MEIDSKIAIFTPYLGVVSETYIKRFIDHLLPDRIVVVAQENQFPGTGNWKTQCPTLVLGNHRQSVVVKNRDGTSDVQFRPTSENSQLITDFLKEQNVRVVFAQFLNFAIEWSSFVKDLNFRFYAHSHGADLSRDYQFAEVKEKYKKFAAADGLIVVNQIGKKRLIQLGISGDLIRVIPCGVDAHLEGYLEDKRSNGIIKVLSVGRMFMKKGPLHTLEAFYVALQKNPNLFLDYIGDGPLLEAAKNFARSKGFEQKVEFHGALPHNEVYEFLKKSDIYIQHSLRDPITGNEEGLPVSILEAMALGVPVVSTRHAGIPDAVIHGETGLLCKEGDTGLMASDLLILSNDVSLRRKMGEKARKHLAENFTWEIQRNKLLEFMKIG